MKYGKSQKNLRVNDVQLLDLSRREEKMEWKLNAETTEAPEIFVQQKKNIEKQATLIVLSYEQRKAEDHTWSLESDASVLC
jgi:hypothetical protein